MRIGVLAAKLSVPLLLLAPAASGAGPCLLEAIEIEHDGFVAFQNGEHETIAEAAPHLADLSELARDVQLAMAEQSRLQMIFLAKTDPDRLVTDKGLSRFENYDWTEADQAAWLKTDRQAAALEEKLTKLKARTEGHPDWPALRKFSRSQLINSDRWRALMSALSKARNEAGAALAACA